MGGMRHNPAYSLVQASIARFMLGIVHAIAFLGTMRLIATWLPRYLGLATGISITIGMLGAIVAQAPMTLCVHVFGWRFALGITALVGAALWLLLYFFVEEKAPNQSARPRIQLSWDLIYRSLNLQSGLCAIYTSLLNLPIIILGALWGNIFLMHHTHITLVKAAIVISMIYFGTVIGSPLIGWTSDYMRQRRTFMIIGAALTLLDALLLINITNLTYVYLMLLFFLLGLFSSAQSLSYLVIVESNPHKMRGRALGIASVIIMGSGVIFQPLFGWLLDKSWRFSLWNHTFHGYKIAFLILPVGFLFALIISLFIKEPNMIYSSKENRPLQQ